MSKRMRLEFEGRQLSDSLRPVFLQHGTRTFVADVDSFLPQSYIRVESVHEVGASARAARDARPFSIEVKADTVVVLELTDGVTIVTGAARLQQALGRIGDDGAIRDVATLARLYDPPAARRGVIGGMAGDLVQRVFTLTVGGSDDPIIDDARRELVRLGGKRIDRVVETRAGLCATALGTRALMWAIEKRLPRAPGLYRWSGGQRAPGDLIDVDDQRLAADAGRGPILVFIHGTASSTQGSFADLQSGSRGDWQAIEARFGDRIFAFEHRTLSESPIRNAIDLAKRLPAGAQLNLVTHSRGGLIGDLICLDGVDRALIGEYRSNQGGFGELAEADRRRVSGESAKIYAAQRRELAELHALLARKRFAIQRYVRVACPARGTRLASGNLDVFLSGLLTLIGWVPALAGNPIYSAFRRVVIEIARSRTNPLLVPGIEAMLPESPLARLLARARPRAGISMAIIAGETDASDAGILRRLGALFTDFVFFDGAANDLVVDTDSMYTGIAPAAAARCRLDSGAKVSHFRYFGNPATRDVLRDCLTLPDAASIAGLDPLPLAGEAMGAPSLRARLQRVRRSRGAVASSLPLLVVVPGIMGSHLWVNRRDRVWFDPADLLVGGLKRVRWGARDVEAQEVFGMFYGDLCEYLAAAHQVEPFAYDWRLPVDRLGDQFGLFLARLLKVARERPVRVLAHSMGGLVVRALTYRRPELVAQWMAHDGARLVTLGTPHQGSHAMVETLIGKAAPIRMLGRLDLAHGLQDVLDIVAGFRGALQLLPRTGFLDDGNARAISDYFRRSNWQLLKHGMRDAWFGDDVTGVPSQAALDAGRWLWDQDAGHLDDLDGSAVPSMWPGPLQARAAMFAARTIHVHGQAARTPCGLARVGGRWKMLASEQGDGSVTWASGTIRGIGSTYYMPVSHGALTGAETFFPALAELLERGVTAKLSTSAPRIRAAISAPIPYDAGPTPFPARGENVAPLLGVPSTGHPSGARPTLAVSVRAMDLRFVARPLLVGHYEQDPIAGAEAIIDAQLVGHRLSERYNLGMYAGPVGTVVVVLQPQNEAERRRGSMHGAIVTGLGPLDGTLNETRLTEAVHCGALRFLMHYADCIDNPAAEVRLSTLLLGYNSSASLGIRAALSAMINGVGSANQKYLEAAQRPLRISSLEIVELYLDTALSTMHALREIALEVGQGRRRFDVDLKVGSELEYGPGWRHRLDDARGSGYWPRLIVVDADRRDEPGAATGDGATRGSAAGAGTEPAFPLAIAERLRFIHVGQRARAETIVRQRQPGVVERLVERQIRSDVYDPDFCRTLFQLMVPGEFKDAARQMQRIVLVLDDYTANLPWELMLADDRPLAARTQVVRQLSSTRFRPQVRPTRSRRAYVIGNPSTAGFFAAFPGASGNTANGLESLPHAEDEARRVVDALRRNGFEVTASIGSDCTATDVLNPLYRQEYRILHVAAHGICELRHADGGLRTGVVLSDGLLITAIEIAAMEVVPDLVFINCCHLARISPLPVAYNRLAYGVARELIEIGVRCVVAAAWPVGDRAAEVFASAFYESLLASARPFGDAVFEARERTYREFPDSMTWGAYQAYGDPGWQLAAEGRPSGTAMSLVSPIELVDRINRLTIDLSQKGRVPAPSQAQAMAEEIARTVAAGSPHWAGDPRVLVALAEAHAQLGPAYFAQAREQYLRAMGVDDIAGNVPVRAIEQLANIEARHGELTDDLGLIDLAIRRVDGIESILGETREQGTPTLSRNRTRQALLGSAWKRKAGVLARRVVAGAGSAARRAFRDAIARSIEHYDRVAARSDPDAASHPTLNGLALRSVHGPVPPDFNETCDRCVSAAMARFDRQGEFWDAAVIADAECVRMLCNGALCADGDAGDQCVATLTRIYRSTLSGVQLHAKRIDTVARQIALLAVFFAAEADEDPRKVRAAQRLQALAQNVRGVATGDPGDAPVPPLANPEGTPAKRGSRRATGARRSPRRRRDRTPPR